MKIMINKDLKEGEAILANPPRVVPGSLRVKLENSKLSISCKIYKPKPGDWVKLTDIGESK